MWFRILLTVISLCVWALFAWMSAHTSLHREFLGRYSAKYLTILAAVLSAALAMTYAHWPPVYARLYKLRYELLLLMFSSVIFGFGLTEGLIRVLDLFGASFYQEVNRYMKDLVPDEELIFRHRPGLTATYAGVEVRINEIGLRERPLPMKSADERRVLVLGDSVTFGWAVRVEDTFCRRLETQLAANLGCKIQTINSGVCGYNTDQEWAFLRRYGDTLCPDVVVLVYVDNDVDPSLPIPNNFASMPRTSTDPAGAFGQLWRKSWVYRIIYHLTRPEKVDRSSPGWRSSMASLSAIAAYCREREIPFVTFLFRMTHGARSDAEYIDISQVAQREPFLFCDMLPWFESANIHDLTVSLLDVHPNVLGHKILSDGMADFLVKNVAVCARQRLRVMTRLTVTAPRPRCKSLRAQSE